MVDIAKPLLVRLPPELYAELEERCSETGATKAGLVRLALAAFLRGRPDPLANVKPPPPLDVDEALREAQEFAESERARRAAVIAERGAGVSE
jgi:hypothetical protein